MPCRAEHVVDALPVGSPGLFNPYRESCPNEATAAGPAERIARLEQHLDCDARVILVGEAPGYQGARYTGVAFTSERLLLAGAIPRVSRAEHRLTLRERSFSEPSATIVWKSLYALGVAEMTVLFNAVQLHPHHPDQPWSNRTPTSAELELGAESLRRLLALFPTAIVVAVGRSAETALAAIGVTPGGTVRHPANGGAGQFRAGLATLVNSRRVSASHHDGSRRR